MGMPVITPSATTREQAVTDIIESVALQETALSHIPLLSRKRILLLCQAGPQKRSRLFRNLPLAAAYIDIVRRSLLSHEEDCTWQSI